MTSKALSALLTFALAALSCAATPAAGQITLESEANDTLAESDWLELDVGMQYIHLGSIGNSLFGGLDVDLTLLDIQFNGVPKRLVVELAGSGTAVDLCLRLFDHQGNQVVFNDDFAPGKPNARIAITLYEDSPVAYWLGVSTRSNTLYDPQEGGSGRPGSGGDYRLHLLVEDEPLPSSVYEPNDSTYSAAPLGDASVSLRGEFIGDGPAREKDVDAYWLQLDSPSLIRVTARASEGSVIDPMVRLRTCLEVTYGWLQDRCDIGISDDVSLDDQTAHVQTFVTEPTDLFVLVSGSPNRRYDPAKSGSGERGSMGYYDLDIEIEPLDVAVPDEPNDSISLATPLPVFVEGRADEITIEGFIGDGPYARMRGDRDFYQIRLADRAQFFHIRSAAESEVVPRFSVFDLDGRLIARSDGAGPSEQLIVPAICGFRTFETDLAAAYLAVTSSNQRPIMDANVPPSMTGGPDYTVEPRPSETGRYRVLLTAIDAPIGCTNEPNDSIPTAARTGIVDSGYFACSAAIGDNPSCPGFDRDMWFVAVDNPPATLHIRVEDCSDVGELDPPVRVLNSDGQQLAWYYAYYDDRPRSLVLPITTAGSYFIAVGGSLGDSVEYDPFTECSYDSSWYGSYAIAVSLAAGPPDAPIPTTASVLARGAEPVDVLYASRVVDEARWIDVLSAATGDVITSFTAPQGPLSGAESLAASAGNLLFGGIGRYPIFHALTPPSGQVVSSFLAWFGSGQYGDAAMLSGVLYIVDLRQQAIHAVDPIAWRLLKTIPVKNSLGITMTGAMAALAGPNRLYVADAIEEERIYEIDPVTGALTGTFASGELRPHALAGLGDSELFVGNWEASEIEVRSRDGTVVDGFSTTSPVASLSGAAFLTAAGDTDGDGDIDLRDVAALQRCFAVEPPSEACAGADVNDDGAVDFADAGLIAANLTGM